MRTPAGIECRFYYQDFHRGRSVQECRLVQNNPDSQPWRPKLCKTCPVPAILRANACPNMVLTAWVGWRWLLFRQVKVKAFCTYAKETVAEPMVGCGRCHEGRMPSLN
ncbi:MAG: hypothetical protein JXA89_00165 [Anaerolineae bacterium]|nr:hypothetical protein [Anaerolineae bacterium]